MVEYMLMLELNKRRSKCLIRLEHQHKRRNSQNEDGSVAAATLSFNKWPLDVKARLFQCPGSTRIWYGWDMAGAA